jgi:hypothetical protein
MSENVITVTITSMWPTGEKAGPRTYDVFIETQPDDVDENILGRAFVLTNMDNRPLRHEVCSTSAGDFMTLNGKAYLVENMGFHRLTPAEFARFQKLTTREKPLVTST